MPRAAGGNGVSSSETRRLFPVLVVRRPRMAGSRQRRGRRLALQSCRRSCLDQAVQLGIEVLAQQQAVPDHMMEGVRHLAHVVIERRIALFEGRTRIAGGGAFCRGPGERDILPRTFAPVVRPDARSQRSRCTWREARSRRPVVPLRCHAKRSRLDFRSYFSTSLACASSIYRCTSSRRSRRRLSSLSAASVTSFT